MLRSVLAPRRREGVGGSDEKVRQENSRTRESWPGRCAYSTKRAETPAVLDHITLVSGLDILIMPGTARASVGSLIYHALNRGNRRAEVFYKPVDYDAFVAAMAKARRQLPLDLLGYCLMPNHFHLILWPSGDGDLRRGDAATAHDPREALSPPLQELRPRLAGLVQSVPDPARRVPGGRTALCERNPRRAELVQRAEDWR